MADNVSVAAFAKVNLFLRVFGREESGYHGLETLFCLLELADELTVHRAESGITLDVAGADTGPVEENLAYRAADAVLIAAGHPTGVTIELQKNIPVGAGLGGGSSDAAAALVAVNTLLGNPLPNHELLQIGARLGSDVPFLVSGAPLALAWNRGERLFRLTPPEQRPVLLTVPPFGISTAAAYAALDHGRDRTDRGAVAFELGSFSGWGDIGRLGGNDFESVVFGKHPEMKEMFFKLASTRPLLTRMSGSGSALFAVYRDRRDSEDARATLGSGWQVIMTATRASPPAAPFVDRHTETI